MTSRLRRRSIVASLSAIAAMAVAIPSVSGAHAVARASRCVDARHAALVTNAVRHGVTIDARDVATWCAGEVLQ
jgi:hypothetical protein